ncbi:MULTISPECIES: N(4)-(beta-N-acetylglucosaminyl)-L-asparaginase [unclassified Rhizobium]|uniref:N(4)-(beta-N-acetylglucosaminyl)-L-asparaginase n=1 Tax=unclassified Rhizobium TaxID=2613769 RepID=UPI00146B5C2D|nr:MULTISPECIES: N(4)-(beta-N-acetylglucosaminyl)-L-asparaginase [unclassified Rhizobium]MBD9446275.1 N(4)-(beta-N-acetylglucosaminyl)-L-asparaginase [Rhizobium sp. RHZ01]MBD9451100.1 N(4)-(beta-N-acetylglucosaminyl)-L-asparaginase [Rhizobium sp. RHZ02]NMN69439.1 L-asparaginase [Rhizobium sp. 57MFTsu3.2]
MLLLANKEAWPGFPTSVEMLRDGAISLDAMVAGISKVESEVKVRSVGYGGWPNMLGNMELDAAVMDGNTRDVGTVGAVPNTLPVARLAYEVMKRLPHVMLTGDGARRFATEIGFAEDDVLFEDSRRVWWERLERELSPEDLAKFPNIPLAPLSRAITDPERVRDTTVFLSADSARGIHAATSTSGWAWKYPGRLGDSPIPGAGFYADSRYGAAACTHTGEMTMRCSTARTVVLAMKLGYSLSDAVKLAVDELDELSTGFLAGVVIHAVDAEGNHEVVNFRCEGEIRYWLWEESMPEPELRAAKLA